MNRFFTIEGVEGSGKTTQAARLADVLRREGHDVVLTREPGGTDLGRRLRELLLDESSLAPTPETELLLYLADRAEWRVTMTVPVLCAAHQIVVLVTGESKAERVGQVFGEQPHEGVLPIERVVPIDGTRLVLLDEPAAARLTEFA